MRKPEKSRTSFLVFDRIKISIIEYRKTHVFGTLVFFWRQYQVPNDDSKFSVLNQQEIE